MVGPRAESYLSGMAHELLRRDRIAALALLAALLLAAPSPRAASAASVTSTHRSDAADYAADTFYAQTQRELCAGDAECLHKSGLTDLRPTSPPRPANGLGAMSDLAPLPPADLSYASAPGWGYGYDSLLADLQRWRTSPFATLDSIGATVLNRAIWSSRTPPRWIP